nr:chloroplast envelope membrane protein [Haymondia wallichii]WOV67751.1 chloroplast envelope membrane protein [Haymondia wallichii]WOV67834.1 chloroplast envelope membrane protein [Haymondia wallichii]
MELRHNQTQMNKMLN